MTKRELKIKQIEDEGLSALRQAGKLFKEMKQPYAKMSEMGLILGCIPDNKIAHEIRGTVYLWHKKYAPDPETIDKINKLLDLHQKSLAEQAQYLWGIFEENRTIGNQTYYHKGVKLLAEGLLTTEEAQFLDKLRLFWSKYPDADSGTVTKDGIEPYYRIGHQKRAS